MTKPTITFTHGFLDDCNNSVGWTKTEAGLAATLTVEKDDVFKISGTCDSVDNEYAYYEKDITNILSSVYTKFLVRWKTGVASNGCGIIITLVFSDASTQDLVGTQAGGIFSTTWTVTSGTITPGKTIDKIRIYADDNPNSIASGIFDVYVDFIMLYKDTFTFPNTQYGSEFSPPPRYATIPIPSRVVDITQNLGSESATWTASCNLDISNATEDWKRPQGTLSPKTDYVKGEVFLDIAHNSFKEAFQWLDTGKQQFKVTLETPRFPERSDQHSLDLLFKEYSRSNKSNESYVERFGLNL